MESIFKGKRIIVTGGAGSIGSGIVRALIRHQPEQIRIFDNKETELFFLKHELSEQRNIKYIRYLLGDVRDKERLNRAMHNIDIVFHAAALKHVPLCEYNPFEAVKTNVIGTENVIETALDNNVGKVINISTDKAVNPINTMGATKLLAEKLVVAAHSFKGYKKTIFSSVRFGNVIGSNGSIVDLIKRQIGSNSKITVTNPEMTRFIMSMENAVSLILETARLMQGGEIFILKMPSMKLQDLVGVVIEETAKGSKPKIKIIGIRPGEKMHECLMTDEEAKAAFETDEMYVIPPSEIADFSFDAKKLGKAKHASSSSYSSDKNRMLSRKEIRKILKEVGLV